MDYCIVLVIEAGAASADHQNGEENCVLNTCAQTVLPLVSGPSSKCCLFTAFKHQLKAKLLKVKLLRPHI